MNRSEAESLRDAIGISQAEGRNDAAWCHRCGEHRVNEPAPNPERCVVPAADHAPSRRRTKAWANASDVPTRAPDIIPQDPARHEWPQNGRLPLLGMSRQGGKQVGASKILRKKLRHAVTPELRAWHREASEGIDPKVLRKYLKEVVPVSHQPGEMVDLPPVAVNLYRAFLADEVFLRLIGDGMPVEEAGPASGVGKRTKAFDRKKDLDAAGGATELFRRDAAALFVAGKIPPGNRIEDKGYARPFFWRLAGGPDALAALRTACATATRAQLTIRQRQADGDLAAVQTILFGQHAGLFGDLS